MKYYCVDGWAGGGDTTITYTVVVTTSVAISMGFTNNDSTCRHYIFSQIFNRAFDRAFDRAK